MAADALSRRTGKMVIGVAINAQQSIMSPDEGESTGCQVIKYCSLPGCFGMANLALLRKTGTGVRGRKRVFEIGSMAAVTFRGGAEIGRSVTGVAIEFTVRTF